MATISQAILAGSINGASYLGHKVDIHLALIVAMVDRLRMGLYIIMPLNYKVCFTFSVCRWAYK